jgi:hypothetical protein
MRLDLWFRAGGWSYDSEGGGRARGLITGAGLINKGRRWAYDTKLEAGLIFRARGWAHNSELEAGLMIQSWRLDLWFRAGG